MAWYDPRRLLYNLFTLNLAIPKIPIVVDGKINPILLTIARRGHWVQSRVLRIPDSFCYFSSGPPLLQALQTHAIAVGFAEAVFTILMLQLVVGWLGLFHTNRWLKVSLPTLTMHFVFSVYLEEILLNPRRASDYDWKARGEKMGLVQTPA